MSRHVVFLSYAHADDSGGLISRFRDALATELNIQSGDDWDVFLDKSDIKVGQQWARVLKASLAASGFLVVFMSPSYFKSTACLGELAGFRDTQTRLGRDDLIFPVYLVDLRKDRLESEAVAYTLAHQYQDLRPLRLNDPTGIEWKHAAARLASSILEALDRGTPLTPVLTALIVHQYRSDATIERAAEAVGAALLDRHGDHRSRDEGPFEVLHAQAVTADISTAEAFAALLPELLEEAPAAVEMVVAEASREGTTLFAVAEDILVIVLGISSARQGRPTIAWTRVFEPKLALAIASVCDAVRRGARAK